MRNFPRWSNRSALTYGLATMAVAGTIIGSMTGATWAKSARGPDAASEGQRGDHVLIYVPRPTDQCYTDEGNGRFLPCDGSDAGG
jgi:hypothetical protein